MKRLVVFVVAIVLMMFANSLLAKTVSVKGYYRKNGTYVRPHTRNIKSTGSTKSKSSKSSSCASSYSETSKSSVRNFSASTGGVDAVSSEEETRRRLNAIDEAMSTFHSKHGRWPRSLVELFREPKISIKLCDGWGRKFVFASTEYGYAISSAGEDGKHETVDDIKSALSD